MIEYSYMKPFIIWLSITLGAFGACSGAYHLYLTQNPRKIFVAVDSSFQMNAVWQRVPATLTTIEQQRYAQFALATEKNRIHGWSPRLQLGTLVPYAPRNFSKLEGGTEYPEIAEAAQKYLITTKLDAAQTAKLRDWRMIQLTP